MIYFTFAGNHDDLKPDGTLGALFNIYASFKDEIKEVFILVTPTNPKIKVNYKKIAEKNQNRILEINPKVNISLVPVDLTNPIEFNVIYPRLLTTIQDLIDNNKLASTEKIINITSGTPTMATCWVLLQQSGIIKNAQLVQSFEPAYAREKGQSYKVVEFPLDDFPQITAPDKLKTELTALKQERDQLQEKQNAYDLDEAMPLLIGRSKALREIKEKIIYDIDNSTHILVTGERGTGKDVVVQSIWQRYKSENDTDLTSRDCGAFPVNLVSSELFGHRKGAFTGAVDDKMGIIEQCDGKMLFLDEIGNLPKQEQQTLLRYLSAGQIQILGGESKKINTQIIAATNKDINDSSIFAQDLKDRFHEIIHIPPLRERKEDIPDLVNHFLKRSQKQIVLGKDVLDFIHKQDWPDNVRGLEKFVFKLVRLKPEGGTLTLSDIPDRYKRILDVPDEDEPNNFLPELPLPFSIDEYLEKIRQKAREQANGNSAEVDRLLKQKQGTEKQRQYNKRKKG